MLLRRAISIAIVISFAAIAISADPKVIDELPSNQIQDFTISCSSDDIFSNFMQQLDVSMQSFDELAVSIDNVEQDLLQQLNSVLPEQKSLDQIARILDLMHTSVDSAANQMDLYLNLADSQKIALGNKVDELDLKSQQILTIIDSLDQESKTQVEISQNDIISHKKALNFISVAIKEIENMSGIDQVSKIDRARNIISSIVEFLEAQKFAVKNSFIDFVSEVLKEQLDNLEQLKVVTFILQKADSLMQSQMIQAIKQQEKIFEQYTSQINFYKAVIQDYQDKSLIAKSQLATISDQRQKILDYQELISQQQTKIQQLSDQLQSLQEANEYIREDQFEWTRFESFSQFQQFCDENEAPINIDALQIDIPYIDLSGTKAKQLAENLKKFSNIKYFGSNFGRTDIGVSEVREITSAIAEMKDLIYLGLCLGENYFGDTGENYYFEAASSLKNLKHFSAFDYNNKLTTNGAIQIAENLKKMTNVRNISLALGNWFDYGANKFRDEGVVAVCESILPIKNKLVSFTIQLQYHEITDIAATSIANLLKENNSLFYLYIDISSNKISNLGVRELCNQISQMKKLESLIFIASNNPIQESNEFKNQLNALTHIKTKIIEF